MGLWLAKVVVLVLSIYYIQKALGHVGPDDLLISMETIRYSWIVALFVLLMVPINWWLEIQKWKYCVRPLIDSSTKWATSSVLRGLSLNWVMPFTLGDFIGRSLGLPRTKATVRVNLVNRFVSMWVTAFMGVLASVFFWPDYVSFSFPGVILMIFTLLFLFRIEKTYSSKEKLSILAFTLLRYLVFSTQLGILLHHFCPDLSITVLIQGIPLVFLIRTVAPSLLGALGVREAAIIWIFLPFTDEAGSLLMASLTLWLFNIVVPSLVGLIPVLRYRIKLST